jgi:hypothetical protein|tara:strand:+ start:104 stop:451 length:348 start_codon:yes stop_codon:yes gene_type:complete
MPKGHKVRQYGIVCKHLDAEEFYFGANHKVYPCCYLYDEEIEIKTKHNTVLPSTKKYGNEFNDLTLHTIDEIQNHEWFSKTLEESFDKDHELHNTRCWRSCGDKGKRSTQKNVES